jgi:chromosome segregation ATPase
MEDELKGISVELASSIRREMDLEDLVDRLQEQINNPQAPGKRTSDYFSDSGYSSAKFSEYDHAKEEISQIQRRAEQEKAQIRLELTNKLQDERSKRRSLDQQIQELSKRASELDVAHLDNSDASGRVKELESMCEDLSRKLSEQSEVTANLEGLLEALQGELQTAANERDNLRDEIVPQLRARVEGLEAEAADQAKLAYDTSKMQQELQLLKSQTAELDSLRAQTAELDSLRAQTAELDSLKAQTAELASLKAKTAELESLKEKTAELDALKSQNAELQMLRSQNAELHMLRSQNAELKQTQPAARMSMGLSRSVSVTGGSFSKNRMQSLTRSNSTKVIEHSTKVIEPRDVLAERLKDVEEQRDALRIALNRVVERQELQNRRTAKRIRQLEMERDRLLTASPKKFGYEREVSILRDEISVLRRRAEEAIEQKWQVEKGLAGLKMDLDRAEGEIASLRSLLQEKDILIPEALARPGSSHSQHGLPVSSHSLEQAYEDLQAAYMDALERIKAIEENARPDEKTQLAIQRLEQSVSAAISDRDRARSDAASYLDQIETLQTLEKQHLDAESDLATQLHESARRIEELAQQVRAQLEANASLRTRLAGTIARGEAEQRVSTERISGMQARLRTLEEQVVAAQTGAEERVTRHEEELASLRDAHSAQLSRLRDAAGGARRGSSQGQRVFPPKSPLSPMFSLRTAPPPRMATAPGPFLGVDDANNQQHPRAGMRRSTAEPADMDMDMTTQMNALKGRVAELEGALASADAEMQEVVGRMSAAQIEVMQLQEQREEAVRETRRLQRVLEEERVRVFEGRWRSLSTEVR